MSFENIVGHKDVISYLQHLIEKQEFSNAYLFSGPEGIGKTAIAQEFARHIAGRYDIEKIEPDSKSETIGIKIARDVSIKSGHSPYEGDRKVFIIIDSDQMTQEAGNCLLKTLEEPPEDTVFILTTSYITRILPTVMSRCQVVKFGALSADNIAGILTLHHNVSQDEAKVLAQAASGSLARAIELLKEDWLKKRQDVVEKFIKGLNVNAQSALDSLLKDRDGVMDAVGILQSVFRDALFAKNCSMWQDLAINRDCVYLINTIASNSTTERLLTAMGLLNRLEYYLSQNGNPKLALSLLDIKMDSFKNGLI